MKATSPLPKGHRPYVRARPRQNSGDAGRRDDARRRRRRWFCDDKLRTIGNGGRRLAVHVLLTVEFFEGLELLDQRLVLILQHRHPIFQAPDVLLLFPPALLSCLSGNQKMEGWLEKESFNTRRASSQLPSEFLGLKWKIASSGHANDMQVGQHIKHLDAWQRG